MLKRYWKFSVFIIVLLQSCATDVSFPIIVPEYSQAMFEELNRLVSEGEPELVIQKIYGLSVNAEDTGDFSDSIRGVLAEARRKLVRKYEAAIEGGDYLGAAEVFKSIRAAGIDLEGSLEEIYLKYTLDEINNGNITPALAVFQNRIMEKDIYYPLKENEYDFLFSAAVSNRNISVLKYLSTYDEYYDEEKELFAGRLFDSKVTTGSLISGTVTILVNRGIRLERGVGYPDKVIGSGFYIDRRGYILTNYHVIQSEVNPAYEGYSRLYIKYDDNEVKLPAKVTGWDPSLDLALLKVEFTPEYIYSFPEEREYIPGETIFAIGSPGGLDKTITSGIISASSNRRLLPLGDTIQVDVPINSGNSGGPVVDESGSLVGMVFAGIEQFEGVNFIIPVKWIIQSIPELYSQGKNNQSWLGLAVHEKNSGLEIIYVMPGTSSYSTGIVPGDEIISIDGIPVKKIEDAQELIIKKRPGTLLRLKTIRQDQEFDHILIVEKREDVPLEKALEIDTRKNLMSPLFGMKAAEGDVKLFNQEYIIKQVYRGMPADEIGLSVNDPFTIINWEYDADNKVVLATLKIKKRKAGFLEVGIRIGNYIDVNNTL
jgi:S1-C subfamily serine protease